ncbi:hypothetical protein ST201phi2-1p448 [Pseudomonas phage 201phi2-1]|uniref:Uncharacterized protein n=1 Tax=Pseudomonas phage 201phi2-1 TaxID=198110 RepID=B3FJV6_BP201|nr:hypothetical protein ST201phi2-1p448 [Pseudomonas phage 201phi2-1]ABY63271.1 hypothetical protein 201phi2-1p448 [Pseudomonas phage 201phi2-1]
MTQEFTTEVNLDHTNVFKRLTRYTIKPIGIILDRHAPPPSGEPVVDPKGEWMKVQQLANIIALGGLMIVDEDLVEHLKDGDAQRALMRDLTALGYDDFEQVMQVLKEQRGTVLKLREFEVWMEGYRATGEDAKAHLLGKGVGYSFNEAVKNLKEQLGEHKTKEWRYNPNTGLWSNWGCTLYDNETEARKFNG